MAPFRFPQDRKGCALDLPLPASARLMLHALRKGVRAVSIAAFDLACSLRPLPLCGGVSEEIFNSSSYQHRSSG